MRTQEEINYIREKILPHLKSTYHLPRYARRIEEGRCVYPSCKNQALPFQAFCQEHLGSQKGISETKMSLASIFGFEKDATKTEKDPDWLTKQLQEFAGGNFQITKDPVKFVKDFFNIQLYLYQQEFFKAFVSLPENASEVLTALFVRQTGKNETIANAIGYLLLNYRNMKIGIFAPTEKQAQAIGLQRVRERLTSNRFVRTLIENDLKDFIRLKNGSFIRAFTANPNSQIEGFTLNIAVLDESQDIADSIVSHDIIPMLASTDGSIVKIGTADKKNHFFKSIERNVARRKFHFQYDYLDVGRERPDYLRFVEKIAEEMGGKDSPEFRSQFLNQWVDATSMLVREEDFNACAVDDVFESEPEDGVVYVGGLDLAKDFDKAVLTILAVEQRQVRIVKFYTWFGTKYADLLHEVEDIYHFWRLSLLGIDSTKEDTFSEILIERGLTVEPIKFTADTKSNIYKNFIMYFEQRKVRYSMRGVDNNHHTELLWKEIQNLEKEWKGSQLKVFTNSPNSHDDYPDSLAIALFVAKKSVVMQGDFVRKNVGRRKKDLIKHKNYNKERIFAKEYFKDGNSKKGEELDRYKNLHKILRRLEY